MTSDGRQSSPVRADYHELSSPDPLGGSSGEDVATIRLTHRNSAAHASNRHSNAAHRRRSSEVEVPMSPSKMVTQQSLSPWRIRVTIEAEPEEEGEETVPSGRTRTITKTMKVPLHDDSSPTKQTKGRSSTGTTSRRSTSPTRAMRSRRQSVTDLDIVVLGDEAAEDEWSAKPRSPRKRRSIKAQESKKAMPASRKSASDVFEIREDEGMPVPEQQEARQIAEDASPELRDIDLNQVDMRARSNSIKQKGAGVAESSRPENLRNVSMNSAVSYPTPSPTASELGNSDDHDHPRQVETGQQDVGLDTVMESEGFTMIDLESLPSVKQLRNTPEHPSIPEEAEENDYTEAGDASNEIIQVTMDAPSIAVTNDDTETSSDLRSSPPNSASGGKKKAYSIGHLQLPSSMNVQRHRLVTPMPIDHNPYSSPKLPSPPRASTSLSKDRSLIHSDQAVQAGSALQDAVTPEHSMLNEEEVGEVPSETTDTLFGGFSSSTKRELRADLRFGEELGKKKPQKYSTNPKPVVPSHPQVWRGETTVQRTPPMFGLKPQTVPAEKPKPLLQDDAFALGQARLNQRMQDERQHVIEQTAKHDAITVESDDEQEAEEDPDETMGDIWLAEAKQTSSSPRESEQYRQASKDTSSAQPRRKLIPSPWKRGQQMDMSGVSADESFSGLLWKQTSSDTSAARFGDAIIAHPERAAKNAQPLDRRSGQSNIETIIPKPSLGSSLSQDADEEDEEDSQDIEDENFDEARAGLQWRSAEDVIEEETSALEAEQHSEASPEQERQQDIGTTRLYETNLEDVPEQDLSSSPQVQQKQKQHDQHIEHDSTYSSISDSGTVEVYRQRLSLSPSKERPITPKSALKGTRAGFGMALNYEDSDEAANARRVMWAKRSSCVNEHWEESTRSVRSMQESSLEETPTLVKQGIEASFEVQPQPPPQEVPKSWFGWFRKDNSNAEPQPESAADREVNKQTQPMYSLDGSHDDFSGPDDDAHSNSSFIPTSRHESHEIQPTETQRRTPPKIPAAQQISITNHDGHLSRASSSPDQAPLHSSPNLPSYLLPPSYPSDPTRDPSIALPTSGAFTNTHFRTLNIIHRKALRPRFHAPFYPDDIRSGIRDLVEREWSIEIDESATMGEDGIYVYTIGGTEARVLERFMREVELGWSERGENVKWGWSVQELAGHLARIAIGERVREEEKAVEGIMRSARKSREAI